MKVYNVNVYDIDQFGIYGKIGNIYKIDKIMVTRGLFGVREIITHQPIKVFDKDSILDKIDMAYYKKYDFVLGINKMSLAYKNMVIKSSLTKYAADFLKSDFLKFLREYDSDAIDQEIVDYRINKILKKMRDETHESI